MITTEGPGIYMRRNIIRRKVVDLDGIEIGDELVSENHAQMMYEPFLLPAPVREGLAAKESTGRFSTGRPGRSGSPVRKTTIEIPDALASEAGSRPARGVHPCATSWLPGSGPKSTDSSSEVVDLVFPTSPAMALVDRVPPRRSPGPPACRSDRVDTDLSSYARIARAAASREGVADSAGTAVGERRAPLRGRASLNFAVVTHPGGSTRW